jgi:hypothetical protein
LQRFDQNWETALGRLDASTRSAGTRTNLATLLPFAPPQQTCDQRRHRSPAICGGC